MIQNVLSRIGGVEVYGLISICLFFGAFLGIVVWALRLKPPYLSAMRELPLNSDCAPDLPAESPRHLEVPEAKRLRPLTHRGGPTTGEGPASEP